MRKKQIQIKNPLQKLQELISYSIPFKCKIEPPMIMVMIIKPDGSKETKPPTDDFRNVLDWLWWKSKKYYADRFDVKE